MKVTADCDSAISKLDKANKFLDFKKNPPFTTTRSLIQVNISDKDMIEWAKQSLKAYTQAQEHLTEAIKEIEGYRKIVVDILTMESDPAFLNAPHQKPRPAEDS